jgi:hypothetical protein
MNLYSAGRRNSIPMRVDPRLSEVSVISYTKQNARIMMANRVTAITSQIRSLMTAPQSSC